MGMLTVVMCTAWNTRTEVQAGAEQPAAPNGDRYDNYDQDVGGDFLGNLPHLKCSRSCMVMASRARRPHQQHEGREVDSVLPRLDRRRFLKSREDIPRCEPRLSRTGQASNLNQELEV